MATKALCSVDGCDKAQRCRGLCQNHYHRLRTHGDPLAGRVSQGEPLAWLRRHVSDDQPDCLIWPFARFGNGYAAVVRSGTTKNAANVMCGLAHGPAPADRPFALHSCGGGQNGCVNPTHLRWGTQAENMVDSVLDGTRARGENQHASKLTEEAVREIRASKARLIDLADRFGVHPETISRVRKRRAWAWLD